MVGEEKGEKNGERRRRNKGRSRGEGGRKEEKELQGERKEDSQSAHLFSLPESICIHGNI